MALTLDPALLAELAAGAGFGPGGSIWRDPHVQQQLLAAHLDDSTPAATRSPEAVDRTVALLLEGLAPGARVLDLGCGPGIYARRLADRGLDVTGVDINAASVAYAREHDPGSRYVNADYTQAMPDGPFDVALLVYLDFGTHRPAAQRVILSRARERLRPGGRLVLDYLDAGVATRHRPARDWAASAVGGFWAPGPHLLLTETQVHPEDLAECTRYALLTEEGVRRFAVWEHCFADESMTALLAGAGFTEVALRRGVLAGCDPQADDVVFAVATA